MYFLEKIEPHLLSEDIHIKEFVLQVLRDYPNVPEEWTAKLVKRMVDSNSNFMFMELKKHTLNEEAVQFLIEGAKAAAPENLHMYQQLLTIVEPELAVEHKQDLSTFLPEDVFRLYDILIYGDERQVWAEYSRLLNKLDQSQEYNEALFQQARHAANVLVKKGWITDTEIAHILNENLNEDYFKFAGIFAIYLIGALGKKEYISLLAGLLTREDDVLLEVTADVLISFQSDQVVNEVSLYVKNPDAIIYGASILGTIKSDLAVQELKKAFDTLEYEEDVVFLIEALAHQLTDEAKPFIDEYMEEGMESFMIESEQLAYSYYKIMGYEHPELENWRRIADAKESSF
ncbi:zinc chelation protein SecC [Peribacillus loiseleuriae]|uniref:zinc chelation protein SecC n=1 Tax=Peribacillus loiseleuriae TaxID=1679170 RepID=UPI0038245175